MRVILWILDNIAEDEMFALFVPSEMNVLSRYEEIRNRSDRQFWEEVIEEGLRSLEENETWKIVKKESKNLIDTKCKVSNLS